MTLRLKLLSAIAGVALATVAFLLLYFGPYIERSFADRSGSLVARGAEAMRAMAQSHVADNGEILVELIRHSTEARRRALNDIPLVLYGTDLGRIRQAIEDEDASRATRLLTNVHVLGRELERRSDESIGQHVEALRADLGALSRDFGSDLRRSYLLLTGGMLVGLIGLLVVGLDRSIVRPIQDLGRATRRVAAGELDVDVASRSLDELGDLASDFAAMVRQLRASREEIRVKNDQLESWNRTLQLEVERKTRHLEEALENLKATQGRLVQADKMASIGTLAGGIAHEFNNLISGIRGCIDDALADDERAQRNESLQVARRATERAVAVTEKLLRFARPRIEGARAAPVAELLSEVCVLVEPQARRQGVRVETNVSPDITVVVDTGEMHQVLLNLLTNALQAMPDGGVLSIEASGDGDRVEIRFADTGVGIPPEAIGNVFDPFYTTRGGATDPSRRGSGLGLSVSYGIVEAHGGSLGVESRPGKGSTFTITLPSGPRPEDA